MIHIIVFMFGKSLKNHNDFCEGCLHIQFRNIRKIKNIRILSNIEWFECWLAVYKNTKQKHRWCELAFIYRLPTELKYNYFYLHCEKDISTNWDLVQWISPWVQQHWSAPLISVKRGFDQTVQQRRLHILFPRLICLSEQGFYIFRSPIIDE